MNIGLLVLRLTVGFTLAATGDSNHLDGQIIGECCDGVASSSLFDGHFTPHRSLWDRPRQREDRSFAIGE